MQPIRRKLWWYRITIPLKLKAARYRFAPGPHGEAKLAGAPMTTPLQPTFHPLYFTYTYYQDLSVFERSQGFREASLLFSVKRQQRDFNPILVALEALVGHNVHLSTGSITARSRFRENCDFLRAYAVPSRECLWFPYYQDYSKYGMQAPWVSGLTQALILSVFLRDERVEDTYLDQIFRSLWVPITEGGVFTHHPNGYPWIAEYPGEVPFVLNGQLTVIIALLEYYSRFPEPALEKKLLDMINGFLRDYPAYRYGSEIRYCWRLPKLANIQYKGLHAFQLAHLYQLTGSGSFRELAEEWIGKVPWPDFSRFHQITATSTLQDLLLAALEEKTGG